MRNARPDRSLGAERAQLKLSLIRKGRSISLLTMASCASRLIRNLSYSECLLRYSRFRAFLFAPRQTATSQVCRKASVVRPIVPCACLRSGISASGGATTSLTFPGPAVIPIGPPPTRRNRRHFRKPRTHATHILCHSSLL